MIMCRYVFKSRGPDNSDNSHSCKNSSHVQEM